MKQIDKREEYDLEEAEERIEMISSRQNVMNDFKRWPTDLWMKVIQRAIEDAALAKSMRDKDEELSEEMKEWEDSALAFLFNKDHKIPFDDYIVRIQCPKCKNEWEAPISKVAAEISKCKKCNYQISTKYIDYRIIDETLLVEISLEELLSLWGVNDIEGFRDGCWDRIEELATNKKNTKEDIDDKKEEECCEYCGAIRKEESTCNNKER